MSQLLRLVPARRLFSGGLRRQMHVKEYGQMVSCDGVVILRARVVLSNAFTERCGNVMSFQKGARALGALIGFTWVSRLTLFILNHGRPVGTDYSLHQLGETLAVQAGRCRCLDRSAFLPVAIGGREVENESSFARNAVDHG